VTSGITTDPDSLVNSLLSAGARKWSPPDGCFDSGGAFETMKGVLYIFPSSFSALGIARNAQGSSRKMEYILIFWGPYELFTSVN